MPRRTCAPCSTTLRSEEISSRVSMSRALEPGVLTEHLFTRPPDSTCDRFLDFRRLPPQSRHLGDVARRDAKLAGDLGEIHLVVHQRELDLFGCHRHSWTVKRDGKRDGYLCQTEYSG